MTEKELRIIDSKEGHLIDYKTVEEGIRSVSLDSIDTIFILTQQHTVQAFSSSSQLQRKFLSDIDAIKGKVTALSTYKDESRDYLILAITKE